MDRYILRGHEPVKADLMAWAEWFEQRDEERIVRQTHFGQVLVSTVFVGIGGPDRMFETMVFNETNFPDNIENHYTTWEEAEAGHARVCGLIEAAHLLIGGEKT